MRSSPALGRVRNQRQYRGFTRISSSAAVPDLPDLRSQQAGARERTRKAVSAQISVWHWAQIVRFATGVLSVFR